MIHVLSNPEFSWEPFVLIYEHYGVFYSKYKPGNAFVVAKVEGKGSTVFIACKFT